VVKNVAENPSRSSDRLGRRLQGSAQLFPGRGETQFGIRLAPVATGRTANGLSPDTIRWAGSIRLRDQDERSWYRLIYLSRIRDVIYVLHCFEKRSRETPIKEINTARQRLKAVRARMI
jgi:phage-related protein